MYTAIIVCIAAFIAAVVGYTVVQRRKRKANPKDLYPLF